MTLTLAACAPDPAVSVAEVTAPDPALAPYQAEIDTLAAQIKAEHPRPFRVISEADFDAVVTEAKASIRTDMPERDTLWAYSRVLTSIGCVHSRLFYFVMEDRFIEPTQRFPVDVRYVEGELRVFRSLSNAKTLSQGDVITTINGRPVDDIVAEIYRHIPADVNLPYLKRHAFNISATSYLTYALDFPKDYRVTVSGRVEPIALQPLETFSHAPVISPRHACQDPLCYRVDEATDTGIMTVRSFEYYGERGAEFADFVNGAFDDLSENDRANLIVDVRDNQGGSGLAGAYILRRLTDEPFEYFSEVSDPRGQELLFETQQPVDAGFDGQTYILMNGNTLSTAPHFFALARANGMATLVGEPAGGNHSTNDGKIQLKSDTVGIDYWIARMRFDVAVGDADPDTALIPDIAIPYTVEETLTREDVMMETLLDVISEG